MTIQSIEHERPYRTPSIVPKAMSQLPLPHKGVIITDFNSHNLLGHLATLDPSFPILAKSAPFGQVSQILLDPDAEFWHEKPDFALVWTRPEAVLPTFRQLLAGEIIQISQLNQEIDDYADALSKAAQRTSCTLLVSWSIRPDHAGKGPGDFRPAIGATRALMEANLRLLRYFDNFPSVFFLSSDDWLKRAGHHSFSDRLWYSAKIPFTNDVFKAAARDILTTLRASRGSTKKLLLLDLDDTLWGGILGDVGWQNLILGGHHPDGEAFQDFQRELLALNRRGIILGILSKNDEHKALEAIQQHPEMILRLDAFAGWRINWNDKADNLAALVQDLNIGLDAVVFIDDSPSERARVREAFPDVLVPEWPSDKRLYRQSLLALDCFVQTALTEEDRKRAVIYTQSRKRSVSVESATDFDDWLEKLGLTVIVESLTRANSGRVAQLMNKTNQMNLSTRRISEKELVEWAATSQRKVLGFRVSDKFGDNGLTGVLSIEASFHLLTIVDFVLSCRVMGRRVEELMLSEAVNYARATGLDHIQARFLPTDKNKPCLDFFRRSGFAESEGALFTWQCQKPYQPPPQIRIVRMEDCERLSAREQRVI